MKKLFSKSAKLKIHRLPFVILMLVPLIACDSPTTRLSAEGNGVMVQVDITNIEYNTADKFLYSLVYANVHADIGENKSLDLDCFRIKLGNNISNKVYIDSVASINSNALVANSDGVVSRTVYWAFEKDLKIGSELLSKAQLLYPEDFELKCVSDV